MVQKEVTREGLAELMGMYTTFYPKTVSNFMNRGSSVGISTGYVLDGRGIAV
jgi:hypothetical protein